MPGAPNESGARIALRPPRLALETFLIARSGFRWTCRDGQTCRAGEMIAYCNITVVLAADTTKRLAAFTEERFELQAALVLAIDGRVHHARAASSGGFIDLIPGSSGWAEDFLLGYLDPTGPMDEGRAPLRLMLGAGRRVTQHAEVRRGFLTGWHMRSRAWWADGPKVEGTLLGVGSCEVTSILMGDEAPFLSLLGGAKGFAQIVMQPDQVLAPCSRITLEQMRRTPEQCQAIVDAFAEEMRAATEAPSPEDLVFAGVMLSALMEDPLGVRPAVLSQGGVQRLGAPDALLISLVGESRRLFRHRRLGYALNVHAYRLEALSPAMRGWMRQNFEPLLRDAEEIKQDMAALVAQVRRVSPTTVLVVNAMSSDGNDEISTYGMFDPPMGRTLIGVHNKELNLVLHDLARDGSIDIIDQDAIVAEMGAKLHLPDGVHQSGALQRALGRELLGALEQRRVPGFFSPDQVNSNATARAASASPV